MPPGQVTLSEFISNQPVGGPLNDTESYFTGQQRQWLAGWLRESADRLHLNHWTLRLWHEAPEDDAHASVVVTEGRMLASFRFDNSIFEVAGADARSHLAHELAHVLFEPASQMVVHDLHGVLGDQAWRIFKSAYLRQMEFAVDHLAGVLAPLLKLPPWDSLDAEARGRKANLTAQERFAEQQARPTQALAATATTAALPTATTNWQPNLNSITATSGTHPPDAEQPPAEQ